MTEKMKDKAKEVSGLVKEIRTVRPGTASEVNGLAFETVPAYNLLKPFHPKREVFARKVKEPVRVEIRRHS